MHGRFKQYALTLPLMCSLSACGSGCSSSVPSAPEVPDGVFDHLPVRYSYTQPAAMVGGDPVTVAVEKVTATVEKMGEDFAALTAKVDTELKGVTEKAGIALKRTGDLEVVVEQFRQAITGRVDDHDRRITNIEDKLKQEFVVPPPQGERQL